jgi:hypothetical protein
MSNRNERCAAAPRGIVRVKPHGGAVSARVGLKACCAADLVLQRSAPGGLVPWWRVRRSLHGHDGEGAAYACMSTLTMED